MWNIICRRFIVRARALYAAHAWASHSATTFNRRPPKPQTINKCPLAKCDNQGKLVWNEKWIELCYTHSIKLKKSETFHTYRRADNESPGAASPRIERTPTIRSIRASYARAFIKPKSKRRIVCDDS